jgi:hypothetical protein
MLKIIITFLVELSRTTLLSFGVLPVLRPEDTESAPLLAIVVGNT